MYGRYGNDPLNYFLWIGSIIVEILGNILRIRLIYYIGLAMFIFAIYRLFSRNFEQRQRENDAFLYFYNKFMAWKDGRGQSKGQREARRAAEIFNEKDRFEREQKERAKANRRAEQAGGTVYVYYYCPYCKQQVRIPQGKGKVRITCPTCHKDFESYS